MKGILVVAGVLALSACATVISSEPPKDMSEFAEVDVASSNGVSDLTIFRVWAIGTHTFEDYRDNQQKPGRLYLRSGKYQATLNCDKEIVLADGRTIHSVLTDISPKFEFEVVAGSRYLLGCMPTNETDGYYLQKH